MKTISRTPPFLLTFLLTSLFILTLKSLTVSSFETNDDALFMMFSSGFYTGAPFEYLIATPVITGTVLSYFYTHFNGISWYGWYLLVGHFIAIFGFLYSSVKNFRSFSMLILFSLVLIVFESYFLAYVQFTTTAFLCGTSGYLLLISSNSYRQNWQSIILGILLVMISVLIRPAIFGYLTVLFTPVFIYIIIKFKSYKFAIALGVCVIGYVSLEQFDSNFHGTFSDWKQYKDYFNNEFHGLADAPHITFEESLPEVLKKVNWTKNDFEMLKVGFFEDQQIYSESKIKLLFHEFKKNYSPFRFEQSKNLVKILTQYKYQTILTILILIMSIFMQNGHRLKLWVICISLLLIGGLMFYMGTFTILKSRILVPTLLAICTISISLFYLEFGKYIRSPLVLIGTGILASFFFIKIHINNRDNIQPRIKDYENEYAALSNTFNGKVLAIWQTSLAFDNINILQPIYKNDSGLRFYYLDWLSGFPVQNQLLNKYGKPDIYTALLSREFYVLLDNSHLDKMTHLIKYYKEHRNLDVAARKIPFKLPDGTLVAYSIFSIETQN